MTIEFAFYRWFQDVFERPNLMYAKPDFSPQLPRIRRYAMFIAFMWTLVIVVSASWALYGNTQSTIRAARIEGEATFNKDLLYRRWVAMHGGVYVPVTEQTTSNPYLDVPNRDVVTRDGQQLTLVNPAYMTRQVHEIAAEEYDVKGHITSLDPIRPGNAPDEWEVEALLAFEQGTPEVSSIEVVDGVEVMRYMQAMYVEESCMACHAYQGYEIGDVRGGISVDVPMQPFWESAQPVSLGILAGHMILWMIGLVGIAGASRRFQVSTRREEEYVRMLSRNEARYRQMFHQHLAVKLVIDPETGAITDANQAAIDFYGYPLDRLKRMKIHDINMQPSTQAKADMERASGENRHLFAFKHQLASGEVRDVDVFSGPIDSPEGRRLYSIIIDTTEKREAERHRQQMVEHLQFLNRAAMELIDLPDAAAIYDYLGRNLSKLFGQNAVIVVNRNFANGEQMVIEGVHGIDHTWLGRLATLLGHNPIGHTYESDPEITQIFRDGQLVRLEGGLLALAKNVLPAIVLRQLVRLFDLGEVYLIGMQKDGTFYAGLQLYMRHECTVEYPELIETFVQQASTALQRIEAEAALRDSEAHLQSVLDSQHTFVLRTDMHGKYTYVNDAMHRQFAWMYPTREEMIGTNTLATVCEEDWPKAQETIMACIVKPGVAHHVELRKPTSDGFMWSLWEFMALPDMDGEVVEFQCVGIDITERKKAAERSFELALEKERMSLLMQFIRHAAHEFRTPLTAINSSAYLISRTDDPERVQRKTTQITQQVRRITRLVDMLLVMSTLESRESLKQQPFYMNDILRTIRQKIVENGGGERVELHYDIPSELPSPSGDAQNMMEAIYQLVDNACRYTPDGGDVFVTVRHHDGALFVEIRDNGVGISEEMLPHIFDTFWRQDGAHSTPGFGLGLPIAQRIIERHGGTISVESVVDKGSTFTVILPVEPVAEVV